MFKTIQIIVLAALCLNLTAKAQNHIPDIKPLKIGDTIPEAIWNLPLQVVNHPEGKKAITLNDYNGKLIILDFWATWCGACIKSFPKLDTINQSKLAQVILVNSKKSGDNKSKILGLIRQQMQTRTKGFSFPIVYEDQVLAEVFPHKVLPHYVWFLNGKVIAITDSYEVTISNIKAVLANNKATIVIKEDRINFDYTKSFRENLGSKLDSFLVTTSLFSNYTNGLVSGKNVISQGKFKRYYFTNRPIIALYQFAFDCLFNRLVIELKDGRKLPTSPKELGIKDHEMADYRKQNLFCYELIVPESQNSGAVYTKMLSDLNQFFQFNGRIEKRDVGCFVLNLQDTEKFRKFALTKKIHPETTNSELTHVMVKSIGELVFLLNSYKPFELGQPIVLDETGYNGEINVSIPTSLISDIKTLEKSLETYGLVLSKETRSVDMCVISN